MTGVRFSALGRREQEILGDLLQRRIRELTRFVLESSTLAPLGIDDVMELTRRTRRRDFAPGRRIYQRGAGHEGEISIFIVAGGRVSLELPRPGCAPLVAGVLSCGDVFGGLPVVAGLAHCDSAVAVEPCQLIEIDEYSYRELCRESPRIARALEHAVVGRACADLDAALAARGA
jgi:CRP-like cAMP-binding protein